MNQNQRFYIPLLLCAFLALGVIIGGMMGNSNLIPSRGAKSGNIAKVQEIIELLDREYVDSIQKDELFEKTISDMLHQLDPHSNYIPAREMAQANEQIRGEFGGIGIRFAMIRDTLSVTQIIPSSPSARVDIRPGDRIIAVNQKGIAKKKVASDSIMGMLRGEPNTQVNVTVLRGSKKLNKRIIRNFIPIESIVCATMLTPEIGYIRLESFSLTSAQEFQRASLRLRAQGMKKLIFDLRDNGGGVLQGAAKIADEFLREGDKIVQVKGAHQGKDEYIAERGGLLENVKLAVLINSNSASASEIFAGCMQDNDRAIIVGRRSFGKGLVQQDFPLKDGSSLRLTIARYYMPSGRCIQKDFDGNIENYYKDQLEREENGELFAPDSTLFKKSKKYKTKKGRIVYGGLGVMPDVFVPIDTSNATYYFAQLRYSPAFQHFAFDYVAGKRKTWKSVAEFNRSFKVDEVLLNTFIAYAEDNMAIPIQKADLKVSGGIIKNTLKAEIARQLFVEQGYFAVQAMQDKEVQRAVQVLGKGSLVGR